MRNVEKVILAHDRKTICGKIADYRLIKLIGGKNEYLICIFYDREKTVHSIFGKITDVAMLYDIIVRNLVTPCTFYDVIEDLTYQNQ